MMVYKSGQYLIPRAWKTCTYEPAVVDVTKPISTKLRCEKRRRQFFPESPTTEYVRKYIDTRSDDFSFQHHIAIIIRKQRVKITLSYGA